MKMNDIDELQRKAIVDNNKQKNVTNNKVSLMKRTQDIFNVDTLKLRRSKSHNEIIAKDSSSHRPFNRMKRKLMNTR